MQVVLWEKLEHIEGIPLEAECLRNHQENPTAGLEHQFWRKSEEPPSLGKKRIPFSTNTVEI